MTIELHQAEKLLVSIKREIVSNVGRLNIENICAMLYNKLSNIDSSSELLIAIGDDYPILSSIFISPQQAISSLINIEIADNACQELQSLIILWLREATQQNYNSINIVSLLCDLNNTILDSEVDCYEPPKLPIEEYNADELDIPKNCRRILLEWWSDLVAEENLDSALLKQRIILLGRLQFSIDNLRYFLKKRDSSAVSTWSMSTLALLHNMLSVTEDKFIDNNLYIDFRIFCHFLSAEVEHILTFYQRTYNPHIN